MSEREASPPQKSPIQSSRLQQPAIRSQMSRWSWFVGRLFGVEVYLHASLSLLLGWVALRAIQSGGDPVVEILFVVSLLASVLVHEFGHVLTARFFSIPTRDVTLYPIGGVATLRGDLPAKAELIISLAGPFTSFALAVVVFFAAVALEFITWSTFFQDTMGNSSVTTFAIRLTVANFFLCVFNLMPALPMDGGRALRAVLALAGARNATPISVRISQGLCVVVGLIAAYSGNLMLTVLAFFVFMGAVRELVHARTVETAVGHLVKDVMTERSQLLTLPHGLSLSAGLQTALKSLQPYFPVMVGEQVLGVVPRQALIEAATIGPEDMYVSGLIQREFSLVSAEETASNLLLKYQDGLVDPVLVVATLPDEAAIRNQTQRSELSGAGLLGMLCQEQLLEYLMVHGIRKERVTQSPNDEDLPF